MKYSFDHQYIGRSRLKSDELLTREVERPWNLTNSQWYTFANQVCKLLNGQAR